MKDAWIYVDESQSPFPGGDSGQFWVAALILTQQVEADLISAALAQLQSDPDTVGNKQDATTIARGYFHASEDSKNAHSWLCRAIRGRKYDATFSATRWHFERDAEAIQGVRLHRLSIALSALTAFQDDFDALHLVVARRDGTFGESNVGDWVKFVRDAQLYNVAQMPWLATRFPAVDVRLVGGEDPGIQVADFLLWAVQRAKPEHLKPTGNADWLGRVGLHLSAQGADGKGPHEMVAGELGRGVERLLLVPPDRISPRDVAELSDRERWALVCEMAVDLRRATAIAKGNVRIGHLADELQSAFALCTRVTSMNVDDAREALNSIFTAFILLCDTLPVFDRLDLKGWTRAAEKRAVAAGYVFDGATLFVPSGWSLGYELVAPE